MAIYDGTDTFTGNNVTGAKLDSVSLWHGTTSPTAGSNQVPTNGLFFNTSAGLLYENTGTLANPTWTQRSSSGSEFNSFTSATTWNPSKQTGVTLINVDTNQVTKGFLRIVVDGSNSETITSGTKNWFMVNPSSSLSITSNNTTLDENSYVQVASWSTPATYHNSEFANFTSEDGTYYYLGYNNQLACYTLSTPYAFEGGKTYHGTIQMDYTTHPYAHIFSWNDDGTKIYQSFDNSYTNPSSTSIIFEYTVPTPYYLYTMNVTPTASYSMTSVTGGSGRHCFSSDGTKLFTYANYLNRFYRHDLSTAWSVSTASYHSQKTGLSAYPTGSSNMNTFISSDGTYILVTSYYSSKLYVYRYTMSTPYDLSTLTYTSNTNMGGDWRSDRECKIPTGNQTHIMSSTRYPYRYTMSANFNGTAYTSVT